MSSAQDVFDVIDAMDVQAMGNLLVGDATMGFGNGAQPIPYKAVVHEAALRIRVGDRAA